MLLIVDEEVQGYREDIESPEEVKGMLECLIDENIIEISIKKRAAKDNSLKLKSTNET